VCVNFQFRPIHHKHLFSDRIEIEEVYLQEDHICVGAVERNDTVNGISGELLTNQ